MLEELLEQEKREQEKHQLQQQNQVISGIPTSNPAPDVSTTTGPPTTLLSDVEFERLRADVLGTATTPSSSPQLGSPNNQPTAQGIIFKHLIFNLSFVRLN